jgi:RNA polymerase sigma-70 factor, ECF subfamily
MESVAISDTCSVDDLVNCIRAGDQQAEAELVERYSRGIMIIIRREVSDTTVVDDLYQETFRIVLEKIRQGQVRDPMKLSGFVCSIARNLAIHHFRHAARWERLIEIEEAIPLPSSVPNQFEELLQKENAAIVRQVIMGLPTERDRQVLFRFYIAEEEKGKICADLGLTSLHFNLVLYRARERYRELYEHAMRGK